MNAFSNRHNALSWEDWQAQNKILFASKPKRTSPPNREFWIGERYEANKSAAMECTLLFPHSLSLVHLHTYSNGVKFTHGGHSRLRGIRHCNRTILCRLLNWLLNVAIVCEWPGCVHPYHRHICLLCHVAVRWICVVWLTPQIFLRLTRAQKISCRPLRLPSPPIDSSWLTVFAKFKSMPFLRVSLSQ